MIINIVDIKKIAINRTYAVGGENVYWTACLMFDRISRLHDLFLRVFRNRWESNYSRSSENWPAVNCLPAGSLGEKSANHASSRQLDGMWPDGWRPRGCRNGRRNLDEGWFFTKWLLEALSCQITELNWTELNCYVYFSNKIDFWMA